MGLDMYVYHVKKLSDADIERIKGLSFEQIQNLNEFEDIEFDMPVNVALCESIDGVPKYENLLPFLTKINVPRQFVNIVQMKKDYGIPENWSTEGQEWYCDHETNKDYTTYLFINPECTADRGVNMEDEEFEQKYVYTEFTDCYLWMEEEVSYWRKEYELRDRLHRIIGNVENCGYYTCTQEMKDLMRKHNGFHKGIPRVNHKTTELFYHPWW